MVPGATAGPVRAALECWAGPCVDGAARVPALSDSGELQADAFARFLAAEPARLWRAGGPGHCTASVFVLDPAGRHVLLTHHRRAGFWAQFGGHVEPGDSSLAATALREGREESGLPGLRLLSERPFDLYRHDLSDAFGACTAHWDTAFLAVTDGGAVPVASAESTAVAWWPVDRLPAGAAADLPPRVARAARLVRARPREDRAPAEA